jgi:hypothetical protein
MGLVTSRVRKAIPVDAPELMEMCRDLHKENAMFSMNDAKVTAMLEKAFNQQGAIIGALGPTGHIEGAIFMLLSSFWYSDDFCLEELFSYVRPEYRRSTNAKELINFGKRCSDELGIPLVIGVVSNERTKAKVGLYQRQLSDPCGAYFMHRPIVALTAPPTP